MPAGKTFTRTPPKPEEGRARSLGGKQGSEKGQVNGERWRLETSSTLRTYHGKEPGVQFRIFKNGESAA